jgi:hypothetical protein
MVDCYCGGELMSTEYCPGIIGPEAAIELTPLAAGSFWRRFVSSVFAYPVSGTNCRSLLPDPYRLVIVTPFAIVCRVTDTQIERARPVRLDHFLSDGFLSEVKRHIPKDTELAWVAEGELDGFRNAFLDAFRFGKLKRLTNDSSEAVLLEWPYYRLLVRLDGLGGTTPTVQLHMHG